MATRAIDRQIHQLQHGGHTCLVFENRTEQLAAIIPFIRHGLAQGECCLYITDADDTTAVEAMLVEGGIDVPNERKRKALYLRTARESFLKGGAFDPAAALDGLKSTRERALAADFSGLRVTIEMSWARGKAPGCERLLEYEALINLAELGERTQILCQYARRRFQPAQICDALRSHPLAIVGDQLYPSLYYEPPELLLGRDADRGVEQMIERLKETWGAMQGLRDGEARYRSLLEAEAVGVVVVDDTGTVVEANDSYLAMVGRSSDELATGGMRAPWLSAEGNGSREAGNGHRPALAAVFEKECVRPDGTRLPILFHTRPVNGGAPLTLGLAFDVSGYRAGATPSGAAPPSPAAGVSAGASRHSPAHPSLVNSDLLERLAAALREPLTPLLAVSRVMRLRAQASPALGHSSEVIERQASHLAMLSEDLQDVVQLSAAPLGSPERADFTEIVRGSVAATRGMFESQVIDLSALLPLERLPITGHPGQIGRALAVLLKAAARRVPRGSRARLTLSREGSPEAPLAALSVCDNALAGAPPANAEVSAPRDLGLGAALASAVLEACGGKVELESGDGRYLTIQMPVASEQPAAAGEDAAPGEAGAQARRVLLVFANTDAALTLAELLTLWGHEVRSAHPGPEVVTLAAEYQPNVLLLDPDLAATQSFDLGALKASQGLEQTELLILGASDQPAGGGSEPPAVPGKARRISFEDLQQLLAPPPGR